MKRYKILAVCVAGLTAMSFHVSPSSAQRYCQNELAPETDVDEGCTAPVGGPITKTNPRFGSNVETTDGQSDASKLIQEALASEAQPQR